ncbi:MULTISPECIES: outer membrane beta-barrel family protein [Chryseobacterium]|uniref:Outer membrane receptor protein involved in Fe transport n=1 Tax=Chryseobacterium geocarposphaerae TaxID=1416776 RepID=A0ABU1LHS4_9FLAO|nr:MULTISPECIES: outer membrane beta-barrel family protein [Chryseobacterium]MDR6406249.1 outer membrane receptor protein involved in Fe transport [Chryseobacterium geocarposphaerae]MDR6699731.1 outer membrane receptor protein involved in Fe transport [Chryseobacterium ginsenosidimutans]
MKKITIPLLILGSIFTYAQEKPDNQTKEKQIEGVTITKTKKAVEQKADRTIFDFSEQPQLNNGNVLEGIKKLPGLVSTDIAGMMYQGKVLDVYLNGRPLNITSNELNSFLEGMPANSVDRIEVITQPGAEFPATSGGAIMNIITNKNANKYLTATYSGNYSFTNYDKFRSRTSNSLNLNARNKIFGWQLNIGQNYRESMLTTNQNDLLRSNTDRYGRGYFAKSGLTFDLGDDRLLLNYDIYHNNNDNYTLSDGEGAEKVTIPNTNPEQFYYRDFIFDASDAAHTLNTRQEAVVTYQKRFDDKAQKLDFQFGYTKSDSKFDQDNIFRRGTFYNPEEAFLFTAGNVLSNKSDMRIANFKVDYSQPLKILDGGKVSLGGLYENQDFDTESRGLTNLEYKRQTTATYLEFQAKLKKFDFILGTRAENYDISGVTRVLDSTNTVVQKDLIPFNKFKLFPNASVQYNLMNQVYVAANYNKKISLPSISALNPNNTTFQGPNTQVTGNPNLQPTIFDNYELKVSAFDYAFIGYSVSSAKNQVAQIIRKDGKNLYNEQVNISNMKIHNFNVGLPIPFMVFSKPISEIMKFNFNPDKINFMYLYAGYQKHDIDNLNNKGFWIFNIMTQIILPKEIKLTANYSYLTPKAGYFYFTAEKPFNNSLDITLTKKFMDNRLTVSVFANDIFNGQVMQVRSNPPSGEAVYMRNKYDTRNFGLSINYKIPTKNKLAKEDPNILNSTKKEENGGVIQPGQ